MKRFAMFFGVLTSASASIIPDTNAYAGQCRDPWVTRAVTQVTGRQPSGSGDSGDCDYRRYGGGRWTTYDDLVGKVRAEYARHSLPAAKTAPAPKASLGQQLKAPAAPASGLVRNGGSGIVANNGSRVIGEHGAGLIWPNGAGVRR